MDNAATWDERGKVRGPLDEMNKELCIYILCVFMLYVCMYVYARMYAYIYMHMYVYVIQVNMYVCEGL